MNDTSQAASTPAELMADFCRRVRERDLDGLVDLYEPQAVFRPSEGRIARGPAEIRAALAELLALDPVLDAHVEEVLTVGDLALVINRWTMRGTAPDGTLVEQSGRSSDVVRRHGAAWRIVMDCP